MTSRDVLLDAISYWDDLIADEKVIHRNLTEKIEKTHTRRNQKSQYRHWAIDLRTIAV